MRNLVITLILVLVVNAAASTRGNSGNVLGLELKDGEPSNAYPLEMVEPSYPAEMRKKGINGQALVKAVVSEEGIPVDVKLLSASLEQFGDSAVDAVKQWYFQPAVLEGVTVTQSIVIPVRFQIVDGIDLGRSPKVAAAWR